MFWTVASLFGALAFGQVSAAELRRGLEPQYFETAISKAAHAASSRIVSGWEAVAGQHPHQASLRLVGPGGGVGSCGGSVVHASWVISAAHCTMGRVAIVVRAGVVHITTPEYMSETYEWWIHPSFDQSHNQVQPNDMSIIKLQIPVTYSDNLRPIRVQPSVDAFKDYANEVVVASGWGRLWTEGSLPETLNWVYLIAISNFDCGWTYGFELINENAICARYYNVTSQSTCQGDSGGPLVHIGSDDIPTLIGIASFVAGGENGCHSEHPAGFVRPGPFIPWLNEITGLDFDNINEEIESTTTEVPITTTTTTTVAPTTSTTTTVAPTTSTTTTVAPTTSTTTTVAPTTSTTTTVAPTTSTTTTVAPTTSTTTTVAPTTSTTTTVAPTTSTTTTVAPTTTTTLTPTTTTQAPSTTTPQPEPESEEDSDEPSESGEDSGSSELLNKLIVKVKVKVKVNNKLKRRIKLKCANKF